MHQELLHVKIQCLRTTIFQIHAELLLHKTRVFTTSMTYCNTVKTGVE